jgi:hypothetical protein
VPLFGEDDIYPLLAAPTCKAEDAADMEHLLARAINSWSVAGAGASAGPIWSFATDGDATRRLKQRPCNQLHDASSLINNSFSVDIDTRTDLKSINLLSAVIESFLTPFINTTLSLFNQVQFLSRYSHLAFAFFHAHWRAFMSYQLYYDTQTTVKNAMFCCTKQQILYPNAPFYLGDVGDDPLEILFGRTPIPDASGIENDRV